MLGVLSLLSTHPPQRLCTPTDYGPGLMSGLAPVLLAACGPYDVSSNCLPHPFSCRGESTAGYSVIPPQPTRSPAPRSPRSSVGRVWGDRGYYFLWDKTSSLLSKSGPWKQKDWQRPHPKMPPPFQMAPSVLC